MHIPGREAALARAVDQPSPLASWGKRSWCGKRFPALDPTLVGGTESAGRGSGLPPRRDGPRGQGVGKAQRVARALQSAKEGSGLPSGSGEGLGLRAAAKGGDQNGGGRARKAEPERQVGGRPR